MVLLHGIKSSLSKVPQLCSPHLMCIMNTSRRSRESNLTVSYSASRGASSQEQFPGRDCSPSGPVFPNESVLPPDPSPPPNEILQVKGKHKKFKGPPESVLRAMKIDRGAILIGLLLILLAVALFGVPVGILTAIAGLVGYLVR